MKDNLTIFVPSVPIAQPRPRAVARNGHARVYGAATKHPVNSFKALVRLSVMEQWTGPPWEGPIYLLLAFRLPRPGRLRWKNKPMPRLWHTSKPDGDNLHKAVQDALNGLTWVDDSQVCWITVSKQYASGSEPPGVLIVIAKVDSDYVACKKITLLT